MAKKAKTKKSEKKKKKKKNQAQKEEKTKTKKKKKTKTKQKQAKSKVKEKKVKKKVKTKAKKKKSKRSKKVKKAKAKALSFLIFYGSLFLATFLGFSFLFIYFEVKASQIINSISANELQGENQLKDSDKAKENSEIQNLPINPNNNQAYTSLNVIEADDSEQTADDWQVYKSSKYYFTIKYPPNWSEPEVIPADDADENYSLKLFFKKPVDENESMPPGFEVIVYLKRYYELEETEPLFQKPFTTKVGLTCPEYQEEIKVGPDAVYPATKVKVDSNNPCFREAYFVSVTRNSWIYNIVPVPSGGYHKIGYQGQPRIEAELPEFNKILETITFQNPPPPITGPKPTTAKKVNGKYVCAGDDSIHWSLANEPGHLDLQCCLDPDETPNPWCSYSAKNLAKVNAMKAKGPPKEYRKKWDID
jgi:hypothetical protein